MSHSGEDKARTLAVEMAAIARASHVEDIAILDLRGASPITDYFLIGTGTSDRQIRAVAEELADHGKQVGQKAWRVAGRETADWIAMDFVDVVVHLFSREKRQYYDLELIWGGCPRVDRQPEPPRT